MALSMGLGDSNKDKDLGYTSSFQSAALGYVANQQNKQASLSNTFNTQNWDSKAAHPDQGVGRDIYKNLVDKPVEIPAVKADSKTLYSATNNGDFVQTNKDQLTGAKAEVEKVTGQAQEIARDAVAANAAEDGVHINDRLPKQDTVVQAAATIAFPAASSVIAVGTISSAASAANNGEYTNAADQARQQLHEASLMQTRQAAGIKNTQIVESASKNPPQVPSHLNFQAFTTADIKNLVERDLSEFDSTLQEIEQNLAVLDQNDAKKEAFDHNYASIGENTAVKKAAAIEEGNMGIAAMFETAALDINDTHETRKFDDLETAYKPPEPVKTETLEMAETKPEPSKLELARRSEIEIEIEPSPKPESAAYVEMMAGRNALKGIENMKPQKPAEMTAATDLKQQLEELAAAQRVQMQAQIQQQQTMSMGAAA